MQLYLRNYYATCHVSEILSWQKWLMRRAEGQKRVHITSFISLLQLGLGKSSNFARRERKLVYTFHGLHARAFSPHARCKNSAISERSKPELSTARSLSVFRTRYLSRRGGTNRGGLEIRRFSCKYRGLTAPFNA